MPAIVAAHCPGVAVASPAGQYSSGQLGARYARSRMYSRMSRWAIRMCSRRCHGVYGTFGGRSLMAWCGKPATAASNGRWAPCPSMSSSSWSRRISVMAASFRDDVARQWKAPRVPFGASPRAIRQRLATPWAGALAPVRRSSRSVLATCIPGVHCDDGSGAKGEDVTDVEPAAAAVPPATIPPSGTAPATLPPSGGTKVGLTSSEAAEQLRHDGPNALGGEGRRTSLKILASQFASPLVLILVAASCVSIAVGDEVEAGIILAIVALSAGLGFVQEARAEASVAALQARLTLRATVIRDGREQEVPVHDVVRGDVVALAAGNIVPADGRLLAANHLYVDESSLTGESAAALKAARDGEPDPRRTAVSRTQRAVPSR